MPKRLFDFIISTIALLLLSPFFIITGILIISTSPGPVFFLQNRVGLNGVDFKIFKFRTMKTGSDKKGLLTIGSRDERITPIGFFLRKYKIDELPQLFNVIIGDMSLVGPRPEVRKYVNYYTKNQLRVLEVRPGITDYASIRFSNESELLAKAGDHEKEYTQIILPEKLRLNLKYVEERNFITDIKILVATLVKIVT